MRARGVEGAEILLKDEEDQAPGEAEATEPEVGDPLTELHKL